MIDITDLTFIVPGPAVGKQRPRVTRRGHAFTPAKTVNYEALIKQTFAAQFPDRVPLSGPIGMMLHVFIRPSNAEARIIKRRHDAILTGRPPCPAAPQPTKKPDLDNVVKIYADALSGLAYIDDKQIVHVEALKLWDERPRVKVRIRYSEDSLCPSSST